MLKMAPKEGEVEAAALWPWMEPFHLPERLWFFRTCLSAENRSCIGTSNRIYPRNPCREIHHWLLKGESISPFLLCLNNSSTIVEEAQIRRWKIETSALG